MASAATASDPTLTDSAAPPSSCSSAMLVSATHGRGDPHVVAAHRQQEGKQKEYVWTATSFARMRAGLRSALKTECSGFKFQNGGRSLRWFREHPEDESERCRLFWQGYRSLYEQIWQTVTPPRGSSLWSALEQLDSGYRQRYYVQDHASRGVGRPHAHAMLADGCVERAVRWALDPRSGTGGLFFDSEAVDEGLTLFALALEGGWTWLLEPWQAAVESSRGENEWRALLATGAIETGSLSLVQQHWPLVSTPAGAARMMLWAVGRSGSVKVFDWLVEHGFDCDQLDDSVLIDLTQEASRYGHVALLEHVASVHPAVLQWCSSMEAMIWWPACEGGHVPAVEWLVSRGTVPDADSVPIAVRHGHYSIVRYLRDRTGVLPGAISQGTVRELLFDSKPDCLAILEFLVQHCQYAPTCVSAQQLEDAATTHNVRSDVLRFLATHATREAWNGAMDNLIADGDLDAQDLLHAAARDAERPL